MAQTHEEGGGTSIGGEVNCTEVHFKVQLYRCTLVRRTSERYLGIATYDSTMVIQYYACTVPQVLVLVPLRLS
jgi:hypothetical protein